MCGDFNMVERMKNKCGVIPNRWVVGKKEAWYFMKNKLDLSNPISCFPRFDFPEHLWFTWSNFQVDFDIILKRIDRVLLSNHKQLFFHRKNPSALVVEPISGTIASNHTPIMFTALSSYFPQQPFKSQFYLNTSFLQHPFIC